MPGTGLQLGRIGAWFNPRYDDDTRTDFVVQAESLGYQTAWLGFGLRSISDLALVERVLDTTATITVATAIRAGTLCDRCGAGPPVPAHPAHGA
jgi:hypothetical protein